MAIRSAREGGEHLRRSAVYCFEERKKANSGAVLRNRYLYELEVCESDIMHRGDLNHYSAIADIPENDPDVPRLAELYWSGQPSDQNASFEVLVRAAKVISKHSLEKLAMPVTGHDPFDLDADPSS